MGAIKMWLDDHGIKFHEVFKYVGREDGFDAYEFLPNAGLLNALDLEGDWRTFFHGQPWYALASTIAGGRLAPSISTHLGHGMLWNGQQYVPGVYATPDKKAGRHYAVPQVLFNDGCYHWFYWRGLADYRMLIHRKKPTATVKEQWVLPEDSVVLSHFYLAVNVNVDAGQYRYDRWVHDFEVLPAGMSFDSVIELYNKIPVSWPARIECPDPEGDQLEIVFNNGTRFRYDIRTEPGARVMESHFVSTMRRAYASEGLLMRQRIHPDVLRAVRAVEGGNDPKIGSPVIQILPKPKSVVLRSTPQQHAAGSSSSSGQATAPPDSIVVAGRGRGSSPALGSDGKGRGGKRARGSSGRDDDDNEEADPPAPVPAPQPIRPVERLRWQYADKKHGSGQWTDFEPTHQRELNEGWYANHGTVILGWKVRGRWQPYYSVDLENMWQTSLSNGRKRKVRYTRPNGDNYWGVPSSPYHHVVEPAAPEPTPPQAKAAGSQCPVPQPPISPPPAVYLPGPRPKSQAQPNPRAARPKRAQAPPPYQVRRRRARSLQVHRSETSTSSSSRSRSRSPFSVLSLSPARMRDPRGIVMHSGNRPSPFFQGRCYRIHDDVILPSRPGVPSAHQLPKAAQVPIASQPKAAQLPTPNPFPPSAPFTPPIPTLPNPLPLPAVPPLVLDPILTVPAQSSGSDDAVSLQRPRTPEEDPPGLQQPTQPADVPMAADSSTTDSSGDTQPDTPAPKRRPAGAHSQVTQPGAQPATTPQAPPSTQPQDAATPDEPFIGPLPPAGTTPEADGAGNAEMEPIPPDSPLLPEAQSFGWTGDRWERKGDVWLYKGYTVEEWYDYHNQWDEEQWNQWLEQRRQAQEAGVTTPVSDKRWTAEEWEKWFADYESRRNEQPGQSSNWPGPGAARPDHDPPEPQPPAPKRRRSGNYLCMIDRSGRPVTEEVSEEDDDHWGPWRGERGDRGERIFLPGIYDGDLEIKGAPPAQDEAEGQYHLMEEEEEEEEEEEHDDDMAPGDDDDDDADHPPPGGQSSGRWVPQAGRGSGSAQLRPPVPANVRPQHRSSRMMIVQSFPGYTLMQVPNNRLTTAYNMHMRRAVSLGQPRRPPPPTQPVKGKQKGGKGSKGKRGRWVWCSQAMMASLPGGAQAVSFGCGCGWGEGTDILSIFLFAFFMCLCILAMYKFSRLIQYVHKKCCDIPDKKPVPRAKGGRNSDLPSCEICGEVHTHLPFAHCKYCKASPVWHHGKCCPAKTDKGELPDKIYLCVGYGRNKYHVTENCRGLSTSKAPVVGYEVCAWCQNSYNPHSSSAKDD